VSLTGLHRGMQWSFVGCVGQLVINGREMDMRKGPFVGDALHGINVRTYIENAASWFW